MAIVKCNECGSIFHEDKLVDVREYRGEHFGFPAYEEWAECPYCKTSSFEYDYDYYDIIDSTVDYLIDIVGESANPQKIEDNLEDYAYDYICSRMDTDGGDVSYVIDKVIEEYNNLD